MSQLEITVAGHICLDIIPTLFEGTNETNLFCPGTLRTIGPATLATGGVVSNTGQTLHRMGFHVSMAGMVGDDPLGATILEILRKKDPELAAGMIIAPGKASSYTVVLNPPRIDRAFLHCPGVNDEFQADDLNVDAIAAGRILHFGYPPLMRGIFQDMGQSLGRKFGEIQARGLLTALDMANPDPLGESGRVDWVQWMKNVLPTLDVFLPSFDEILLMTDKARYDELAAQNTNPAAAASLEEFRNLASLLIEWGAKIVVMKLGDQGLYLQTAKDLSALQTRSKWSQFPWSDWAGQERAVPCFSVPVVGTTGSGDATVGGFLGALLRDLPLDEAGRAAVAAGACNVQAADAVSGIPSWETVLECARTLPQRETTYRV